MEIKEAINQLINLRIHCESQSRSELSDEVWTEDMKALDIAIKNLREKQPSGSGKPKELQLINISRRL